MECKFRKAWTGICGEVADNSGFCEGHREKRCCSCGEQAIRECEASVGACCGAPLCNDCTHKGFLGHKKRGNHET